MPLFTKPSQALVYDLINEANPDLPIVLSPANFKLGAPAAGTVPGRPELNTVVTGSAIGTDYIGRKPLNYQRLSLNSLFRGMVVQINKYSANQNSGSSGAIVFTLYQLLPIINTLYGMNLTEDDVTNVNITRGTAQENGFYTSTVTVNAKATSLGYIGSFALKWRGAPQDLESMITVTDLAARLFPGGNTFDGTHPVVVNNMAYNIDWTSFIATAPWGNFPGNPVAGNDTPAFGNRFIAELNRLYGKGLVGSVNNAPAYAYMDWGGVVYDLSTQAGRDACPLANSKYYNRVLVWTIPDYDTARGSGIGQHFIHFNV
jgi:hypothetical protein